MDNEVIPLSDSIQLALNTQEIVATRRELAQHTSDDKEFQEKIFQYLEKKLEDISEKLDAVWDDMTARNAKKLQFTSISAFANAMLTLVISAGTAFIIMKYGK